MISDGKSYRLSEYRRAGIFLFERFEQVVKQT